MNGYPHKTEERLDEASALLERLKESRSIADFKRRFDSFVNSVIYTLYPLNNNEHIKSKKYDDWWEEKSVFFNTNPICLLIPRLRNELTKGSKELFNTTFRIRGAVTLSGNFLINLDGIKIFKDGKFESYRHEGEEYIIKLSDKAILDNIKNKNDVDELMRMDIIQICTEYLNILKEIIEEYKNIFVLTSTNSKFL